MASSNFRGPVNSMGAMELDSGTSATPQVQDGPSVFYQGNAIPDPRFIFNKDTTQPGAQPSFYNGQNIIVIDAIPQAGVTTTLAAAQVVTATVAVSLVTAQPAGVASVASIAVGVPIIPVGTTVATVAAFAIDFGFTTGTTATNSSTVVVVDSSLFRAGSWIVIAGAGNSSASRSLVTQVQSVVSSTAITISPAAATVLANVPIGQANLAGSVLLPPATQFGPAAASANAHAFGGAMEGGFAAVYNPREMSARNISMTLNSAGAFSAVVSGWDVYGNPMTEVFSVAAATTAATRKAFKYISSITSGTTTGQTTSFGLGETFGLPIRSEYWEMLTVMWNGSLMTNRNGFAAPTSVFTANGTTDVRGTLQVSTAIVTGVLATSISAVATNGTGRLFVAINQEPMFATRATPLNNTFMFGVAQYTATT